MTREEAIERLQNVTLLGSNEYRGATEEAVGMAIDALKEEPVDCTDFIHWIRDEVLDEENWELNAVANGEIICRKLKKLGAVFSEGGYYHSTEPVHGEWIRKDNTLECPICGAYGTDIKGEYVFNFCPNCGADMRGENNE